LNSMAVPLSTSGTISSTRKFFAVKTAPKPEFRYNNFGGNIGGPIRKNTTFVFLNYEGFASAHRNHRFRDGAQRCITQPGVSHLTPVERHSQLVPLGYFADLGSTRRQFHDHVCVGDSRKDTGSVRLDHRFRSSDSAFVRLNINDSFYSRRVVRCFPELTWP